ncbi:MAG: ubiquinol-cytochrome c reductase iron-sulfur subunit [Candidatus Eiseniibacteriota bacterium]
MADDAPRGGRREFLANLVLGITGLLSVGALASRMFGFLYPVVPPEQFVEVPVGSRDQIRPNGGMVVNLPVGHVALVDVGGELRAFSAVCTHLGCIIKWQPAAGSVWLCPCHKGAYDRDGHVVSGPPPRPLKRYEVAVRDGKVFVKIPYRPPALPA